MSPGPRPADERLRRLLVMLPWLMERGHATIAEMAERFAVRPAQLIRDLELASMCGLPPYTGDVLLDIVVDEDTVTCGVPKLFVRPLRLTPREGFALLTAGRAALALDGADPHGSLARALDKLERVLGARAHLKVELDQPPLLAAVTAAAMSTTRIAISYYSAWRDELTERLIDPQLLYSRRGLWYVIADDSRSGQERIFRIDRIESVRPVGEQFVHREVEVPADDDFPFATAAEARRVRLRVPRDATWVFESYPTVSVTPIAEGGYEIVLDVAGPTWLEVLLLRLGRGGEVVDPPDLVDVGRRAAARLAATYRTSA